MKTFFEMLKDDWHLDKKFFFIDLFILIFLFIQFCIIIFLVFQPDIFSKICGIVGIIAFTILSMILFSEV